MLPLGATRAFVDAGFQPRTRPTAFDAPRQVAMNSADVRSNSSTGSAPFVGAAAVVAVAASSRHTKRRVQRPATTSGPVVDRATTKKFRRDLMKSDQYFRFGRTQMDEAMNELKAISGDDLVSKLRQNGFQLTVGDITFVLAESYGFCWGVERAVAMAYEARKFFPDKKIWVTNEIIHNPLVNKNLSDLDMAFIQMKDGEKDFTVVNGGDVVILPAFGASVDEMALLQDKGAQIVDTTCPWVSKVWQSVEKSKDKGHTSIIHGKYDHEETVATKSFAQTFLIVKDMVEAEYVVRYVLEGGDKAEFMKKFKNAMSDGFDPDVDLDKVGVANQTTMLKGETELIAKLFERTMIQKFGPQEINQHFVSFNTICDATQERQDAMYKMFGSEYEPPQSTVYAELEDEQIGIELLSEKEQNRLSSRAMEDATRGEAAAAEENATPPVDLCLIVGGYNSSNTAHLLEIALDEGVPAYHVDCADRISRGGEGENTIEHKPLFTKPAEAMLDKGLEIKDPFLPEKRPLVIGVTSGASTPDKEVGECLQRILALADTRN
mmetsp:Transcript_30824/g.70713  ORF Transcript_30824/g.70713 Transcript_30824/m.70713 type:complete len:549 (+) Transcript_30824:77-1723(+)